MEDTQIVTFTKFHPAFSDSDELGVPKTLRTKAAQEAIDLGIAVAGKKAPETAVADTGAIRSINEPIDKATVKAATEQRAIAHGKGVDSVEVTTEGGKTMLPVGTEPDGNKVLIRPEDKALTGK